MLKLHCLPLGDSRRDQFILDYHHSVFLLPSSFLLNQVREKMSACCVGHEQLKLLSFDELVSDILRQAGIRRVRVDRLTQEMLVGHILSVLAEQNQLPYFSNIAAFPGYISTVTDLLGEIKRSGTSPQEFRGAVEAKGMTEKDQEVALIYAAYQQALTALDLADLEEMYLLAAEALETGTVTLSYRHLYVSEFYILTSLQIKVLLQLSHSIPVDIALLYEKNRSRLYTAAEDTVNTLIGNGFTANYVQAQAGKSVLDYIREHLFSGRSPIAGADGRVAALSSPRRGKEMFEVANQIKMLLQTGKYRPQDIAAVVRDPNMYHDLRNAFDRVGVPVSISWDETVIGRPLVQFILNCFVAQINGGERHTVKNLLKSPLAPVCLGLDADMLECRLLTKVIRNWSEWIKNIQETFPGDAGADYKNKFMQLQKLATGLPGKGSCAVFANSVKTLIRALSLPEKMGSLYREGVLPLSLLKAELQTIVEVETALDDLVHGFELLGKEQDTITITDFLRFFQQAVGGRNVRLEHRDSSGVQVVSPTAVRGVRFPVVFVLGLTEGEFPQHQRENWLYNEAERRQLVDLGITMSTESLQRAQEDLYFAISVAMADERLVLSCLEDQDRLPSPYLEEVVRLFADGSVPVTKFDLNEWFTADYKKIGSREELIGKTLTEFFAAPGSRSTVPKEAVGFVWHHCLSEEFKRRFAVMLVRRSSHFSEYDGVLKTEEITAACRQIVETKGSFSISALESYAKCPFAYFAQYLLQLDGWEEQDEELGLDVEGTLYHAVLAEFMQLHRDELLNPVKIDEYHQELDDLLRVSYDRLIKQGKMVYGDLWKYDQHHFTEVVRRWLDFEIAEQTAEGAVGRPHCLEWDFESLELNAAAGTVTVRGKIDRIDLCDGTYVVTDYKRSRCPGFSDLKAGVDLQIALYILAVERQLGTKTGRKTAGGGYYSIEGCKKDGGMWRKEMTSGMSFRKKKRSGDLDEDGWNDLQTAVISYAVQYANSIREACFPVLPGRSCSNYCLAKDICRYDKYRMAAKSRKEGKYE